VWVRWMWAYFCLDDLAEMTTLSQLSKEAG
jgi:hypothetical protein